MLRKDGHLRSIAFPGKPHISNGVSSMITGSWVTLPSNGIFGGVGQRGAVMI